MRRLSTRPPSFPQAPVDAPLPIVPRERWQVLCGDSGHYRVGAYSPEIGSSAAIGQLEWHDCPELFVLLRGRLTLVLSDGAGKTRELALEPDHPVLVTAPHAGYCPDGPFTGVALVVERDAFETEYRPIADWRQEGP